MLKGEVMKERRAILGYSLGMLANHLGVEKSTVSRWENGTIKNINEEHLQHLAQLLETSVDHLCGNDETSVYRPILGEVKAGYDLFAEQNIIGYEAVSIEDVHKGDYFLQVVGDSMTGSRIYDGDLIYVKQCNDVENGQIAIVLIDNEVTVKKIKKDTQGIQLIATNPSYETRYYHYDEMNELPIQIIGRVVHITVRF